MSYLVTYYQEITGVCCTVTTSEFFTDINAAEAYCEKDRDCMSLYSPSISKNEIYPCREGSLVDAGDKLTYLKAKGTI